MKTVGYVPGKGCVGRATGTEKAEQPLTKAVVVEKLTAAGVEFDKNAKLEELMELLPKA